MTSRSYPQLFLLLLCLAGNLFPVAMPAQTLLRNIGVDSLLGTTELGSSDPSFFTALNDQQFVFQARTSPLELGTLYVSDGTRSGTQKVGTVTPDGAFIRFKDRVYFYGTDLQEGPMVGLWATDGTEAGTELIFPSVAAVDTLPIEPADFFVLDTLLLFSGLTATHGRELWRTDGTLAGTQRLTDLAPGTGDGFRGGAPAVIEGQLYFTGFSPATGLEPWRTDGTVEGTVLIQDLNPGPNDSGAADYTASGGYIYFTGLDPAFGREVRRMRPGQHTIELIGERDGSTDSSDPRYFVDADGSLFYVASYAGADGLELVTYDHEGEPEVIGPTDIFPQTLKPFGEGSIVFKARDSTGRELWISDGTHAGTRAITDLYPGPNDGVFPNVDAQSFHVFADSLVYYAGADGTAADGEFISELFVTDGTAAGTRLVSDQVPGPAGSAPGHFFSFRDQLYFAMTDPLVGREPFVLTPSGQIVSLPDHHQAPFQLDARVFPNPAPPGFPLVVDINTEYPAELQVTLLDVSGRHITQLPPVPHRVPAGQHLVSLALPAGLAAGTYFLHLRSANGTKTLQLKIAP